MIISSTDVKNNFGKYIRLAAKEDIIILASPKVIHQKVLYELSAIFYNWFKGKKCTPMLAPFHIELILLC